MERNVHSPTKSKILTITLTLSKIPSQNNLVISHLTSLSSWLKLIMKRLCAEFSDSYNFSAKTTMLKWNTSSSNKSTMTHSRRQTQSISLTKVLYCSENCSRLWTIKSSPFRHAFSTLSTKLPKCHALRISKLLLNPHSLKIFHTWLIFLKTTITFWSESSILFLKAKKTLICYWRESTKRVSSSHWWISKETKIHYSGSSWQSASLNSCGYA